MGNTTNLGLASFAIERQSSRIAGRHGLARPGLAYPGIPARSAFRPGVPASSAGS